ncbi:unnamed protein product [Lactuca virosa]|uniref:Uroporphyrinogen-III synthase n=1 Tax=Lactuca virosa TaxID=75947 RepID=A0AAU9N0C3_9ASTR|nr:unnamed protein product [Lactuca virosa]
METGKGMNKKHTICLISANVLRGEFLHGGAVLDCCFHDDTSGFSASADNTVTRLVFDHEREDLLGRHDAPVRCIEYSYATGQVITGSWDKTLKCWDPRGGGYALSSVEGRVAMEFFDAINSTLQFKVTSPEAALVFLQAWKAAGTPNVKVAAVVTGTSTIFHEATPSSEQFIEVAFTPSKATGKVLASEPPKQGNERCTVLYPASAKVGHDIGTCTTCGSNHSTTSTLCFCSCSCITFYSWTWEGSVACIGETTASAARKLGLTNVYHPSTPGLHGWVDTIFDALRVHNHLSNV